MSYESRNCICVHSFLCQLIPKTTRYVKKLLRKSLFNLSHLILNLYSPVLELSTLVKMSMSLFLFIHAPHGNANLSRYKGNILLPRIGHLCSWVNLKDPFTDILKRTKGIILVHWSYPGLADYLVISLGESSSNLYAAMLLIYHTSDHTSRSI